MLASLVSLLVLMIKKSYPLIYDKVPVLFLAFITLKKKIFMIRLKLRFKHNKILTIFFMHNSKHLIRHFYLFISSHLDVDYDLYFIDESPQCS